MRSGDLRRRCAGVGYLTRSLIQQLQYSTELRHGSVSEARQRLRQRRFDVPIDDAHASPVQTL